MLPHVFDPSCWCRPRHHERDFWIHRHLCLTYDPTPRATLQMCEGVPV